MKLVTIGAYGFTPRTFVRTLRDHGVDTFVDLRRRRAVRGSQYAFFNRRRLEALLAKQHIRYIYMPDLAPPADLLALQLRTDRANGESPRTRSRLAPEYIRRYKRDVLGRVDRRDFADRLGDARVAALFCVETEPACCHRSLVARAMATGRVVDARP
jgi:uncharacterized protein (DUF488 family)